MGYGWFTACVGSWFGGFGMQGVLFAWVLVSELDADSEWVGIAQTASMVPSLFLILIGGATADRYDPRRLLIGLHLIAPLPVLVLAAAAGTDNLSIPLVIAFALSMGTLTAFGNPARDALLARVAGEDLMGAISGMTAVQFGSQALGALVAGLARLIGSPTTLCIHACILLSGALFSHRIPRRSTPQEPIGIRSPERSRLMRLHATLQGMREGLAIIARSPELRGSLLAVFAVGLFFIGPFSVVLPLMIRDVYSGDVDRLAISYMLFPLGTISGSLVLRKFGLPRKGRAMLISLTCASLLQAILASGLPFWAFAIAIYGWGLGGSVFINASRTVFQEHSPAAFRGRVLSAYQLGFMGGGPIGALASGFAASAIGLHGTFLLGATGMGLLVLGMSLFSRLPSME